MIEPLELEVAQWLEKADQADRTPLEAGLTIPEEITRRQDSGFYGEAAVQAVEQTSTGDPSGTTVYAALEKTSHHRSVSDLEKKEEPEAPAEGASVAEVMKHRLKSKAGRAKYKLRQQTVEPVFGIVKSVLGFRRFLLRGMEKVSREWTLVSVAYNLKRLHRLTMTV